MIDCSCRGTGWTTRETLEGFTMTPCACKSMETALKGNDGAKRVMIRPEDFKWFLSANTPDAHDNMNRLILGILNNGVHVFGSPLDARETVSVANRPPHEIAVYLIVSEITRLRERVAQLEHKLSERPA